MLKKLFANNNDNISIVKQGRGRYIKFHSYKIFESGKIETIDGKTYKPLVKDGKAYLTLKFSDRTLGAAELEIARIVYSYFVSPIDIVGTTPVVKYLDGNGCNFRLDNLQAVNNEDVLSVVEDIENNSAEDVQAIVNENNTGSLNEVENDKINKTEETVEYLEDEVEKSKDNSDKELDKELIDKVAEVLEEEKERLPEKQEIPAVKNTQYTIEEINNINTEAFRLVQSNFVEQIQKREQDLNDSLKQEREDYENMKNNYQMALTEKDSEIAKIREEFEIIKNNYETIKKENIRLIEEKNLIAKDYYIIKKEQMQKIYKVFDKLVKMVHSLQNKED